MFITLNKIDGDKISLQVDHIINMEDIYEESKVKHKFMRKTWFGFGKKVKDYYWTWDKTGKLSGCNITTSQRKEVKTRYCEPTSLPYQYGGDNVVISVKQTREKILKMIKKL